MSHRKPKLLNIGILAILSAVVFYIAWNRYEPSPFLQIEKYETVRFMLDGYELKILTNTYSTNRNFVFMDSKTDSIVTTLSVENSALWAPYYRVVKGRAHDWLVITRVANWGTGMRYDVDEWYMLRSSGEMKMVLSYSSDSLEVPQDGSKNKYWRTDILNESYPDDSAVDIKVTEKICSPVDYGGNKDCTESSHTVHYVWDADKEEFVTSGI